MRSTTSASTGRTTSSSTRTSRSSAPISVLDQAGRGRKERGGYARERLGTKYPRRVHGPLGGGDCWFADNRRRRGILVAVDRRHEILTQAQCREDLILDPL